MTNAGDIKQEVGDNVVANHQNLTYWIPGQTDVSDLPTIDGFTPVPDPVEK